MDIIPAYNNTSLDEIPKVAGQIRKTFLSHKTRPIEYRLTQLRKLYWGYVLHLRTHDHEFFEDLEVEMMIIGSKIMERLSSRLASEI